ncbi:MAG: cystathionine gamma-synthase family protein [Candidatus Baldrarchaeia archaeon]
MQTDAIHGSEYFDEDTGTFIVPIFQTAIFELERNRGLPRKSDRGKDLKYSREENPTVRALEKTLAKIDKGEDALSFSSGMAAISSVFLAFLKSGGEIVIAKEVYGSTLQLALSLKKFGVKVTVAGPDTEQIIESISERVSLVFVETMTNPMLRVLDIPAIIKRCKEVGATIIVDNTFVTPVIYRPLLDGADLVIHSATKYLAGHNDVIAGVIVGPRRLISDILWDWRRLLGCIISPFDAFLVLRGLKTLELRVKKHCENAKAVAEFLNEHPKVSEVLYPGLPDNKYHGIARRLFSNGMYGGVVSFRVKGNMNSVIRVMSALKMIKISPSLGGTESIMTYPIVTGAATMPPEIREELGITEDLLRLSVGLEDVNDIIEDLDRALKAA